MIHAYIYINVGGVGYKALRFPRTTLQEKRLLRGVRSWVKSSKDFDSYDSSVSIRVIDTDGNILYTEYSGHAWDVAGRVQDALWYAKGGRDSDTES